MPKIELFQLDKSNDSRVPFGILQTVNDTLVEFIPDPMSINWEAGAKLAQLIKEHWTSSQHKPKAVVKPASIQAKAFELISESKRKVSANFVLSAIRETQPETTSNAVTGALKHLCEKGLLTREGSEGSYVYFVPTR